MKLIRGLIYATVGLAVGLVLKRFLDEEQPEPITPTPSASPSPPPPAKKAKTDTAVQAQDTDEESIPVVDLDSESAAPEAVTDITKKDDLTQINGIGPTYAKRLHAAGITTFAQLAAQNADSLREITKIKEWQAADPTDWITEAKNVSL